MSVMPPPKHDRSHDMRRSVSLSSKEHGFSFGIPRSQLQYFPLDPTAQQIFCFHGQPEEPPHSPYLPTPLLMLPKLLLQSH